MKDTSRTRIILALLSVYLLWGSTYLAIRIALEGFPPFMMAAMRFIIAGTALYIFLRLRGEKSPTPEQWRNAAIVGGFLLLGGNGGVVFAEQWVASSLAAMVIATTPLWMVLFTGIWGRWPSAREWAGLGLGLAGVVLLNLDGDLRAYPLGAAALIAGSMLWAFGSAWSRHLSLPSAPMAIAAEMMAGGVFLMVVSLIQGESLPGLPSLRPVAALVYLIVFGSLVGFSSYVYLLRRVRPALAMSYAYVNPLIALLLGVGFAGEHVTKTGMISMGIIIAGVALIMTGGKR
ncbi:MAG: drug/metabolite exporter YedA [Thermodesulfovibrionales bacterium]|jgi:drug/metabolite transporter (DMT)-like permease